MCFFFKQSPAYAMLISDWSSDVCSSDLLGVYPEVAADLWPIDPVRGDRYLLCSDGLFNEVGDDQMAAVLRRLRDPSEAAAELVRLANEGGGRDNKIGRAYGRERVCK